MPASGHQDHTTSPSACSIARQARRRVHRIPLRVRDVAQRPSEERDGRKDAFDLGVRSMSRIATDWHDGQISRGGAYRNTEYKSQGMNPQARRWMTALVQFGPPLHVDVLVS